MSKYVKVDGRVPLKKWQLLKIKHHHKVDNLYILCTAPNSHHLFEIIHGKTLSKKYADCYVLGVSNDKKWLVMQIVELIDQLYNTQTLEYTMLKVQ
ncbi:MAG: hypothetical protein ACRDDX_12845 [Cellulosilyticaceae bacterium]